MNPLVSILAFFGLVAISAGAYWIFRSIEVKRSDHSTGTELPRGRAAIDVLTGIFVYVLLFGEVEVSSDVILGFNLNFVLLLLGCTIFFIDYSIRKRSQGRPSVQ
ncbi:hypothetical protein ES703_65078 [subsurface metagenome]